ncbi:MAG: hypothetical protein WC613_03580 [Candidatus Aenigmatarchaeota archaeon]
MPYHYGPSGVMDKLDNVAPGVTPWLTACLNTAWEFAKWAVPVGAGIFAGYETYQASDAFSKYMGFHDSIRHLLDYGSALAAGSATAAISNLGLNIVEDMHYDFARQRRRTFRTETPAEVTFRQGIAAANAQPPLPQPPAAPAGAVRVLGQQYRGQI